MAGWGSASDDGVPRRAGLFQSSFTPGGSVAPPPLFTLHRDGSEWMDFAGSVLKKLNCIASNSIVILLFSDGRWTRRDV
jgi:hypothetical protein